MRRRFFATSLEGDAARIEGAQAAHLARVLRAQPGQEFELAHAGRVYLARVEHASPRAITLTVESELEAPAPEAGLQLAVALFKFDRWEWMVEKATELGVTAVLPVVSQRSDPRLAAAAPARLERWRTIAFEAAQQSRRASAPEIAAPQTLAGILADPWTGHRILLAESGGAPPLEAVGPEPARLLCGPEGGWTEAEMGAALVAGYRAVSLGPRILRCETAALAALARVSG